jgi:basic membrane lipoprotein Med (substrate-binding protein (PBP1-ABC) superfamily)
MRVRIAGVIALVATAAMASGCGNAASSPTIQPYKVAWIYVGTKNDAGWTKAHDDGRLMVERELGNKVKTTFKESVPEGPQTGVAIEDLIRDGNKLIFATSFGYQDAMAEKAKKYPNVYFEQATGFKLDKNLAEYFGAGEDGDYLAGMAAGAATKNGKLGFVAPFPIPEVIREINAWTLGAQSMRPGASVQVSWTNTWFDPGKEKKAAESLLTAGVDVLGQGQDSPATGEAAKVAGKKWTGYDSDQSSFAPEAWLTGTAYNWGPYYTRRVKAAMDGSWKSESYYGSLKDGFIKLSPFGVSVSADTRAAIEKKKQALIDGTFYEFTGPLKDQSGAVKVPAGTKMTLEQILTMDWFVQGVIGKPTG